MIIKTWRNPYETGVNLTTPKEIELNSGLTVLVGCNGAGKTTLINNIKSELNHQEIPYCIFDNLKDGGSSSISSIFSSSSSYVSDIIETGISLWTASEGEAIKINLGRHSTLYKTFLETGYFKDKSYEFKKIFSEDEKEECLDNKRVFLFDATDSGMSIDSIIEIKNFFNIILEDAAKLNLECYIIISANEYELARNSNCFDVNKGKYITFSDYEDYRKFIIKSRKFKEKRIDREIKHAEKEREKEYKQYLKLKEKYENLKIKIEAKPNQSYSDKYKLSNAEDEIRNYIRNEARFLTNEYIEEMKNKDKIQQV